MNEALWAPDASFVITADAPKYVHQWRTGDIVAWDNVGVQHRRDAVTGGLRRHMRQYGGLAE